MPRLLFEKVNDGIYLSHLDLIRAFQRAFSRAGLMLKHSQGFSPKPYVAVALALSVGMHSICEIMDYELEDGMSIPEDIAEKLNATLPKGIRVLAAYDDGMKFKELSFLTADVFFEYDAGIPAGAAEAIKELFGREEVVVSKHSKRGDAETNIRPMIRELELVEDSAQELRLHCTVCAQNPNLNPMLLVSAVETYLPEYRPDFAYCRRLEVLTADGKTFR